MRLQVVGRPAVIGQSSKVRLAWCRSGACKQEMPLHAFVQAQLEQVAAGVRMTG